jgi:hypothetical protein
MANKTRKKDTPEYWRKLLNRHGLSMEKGRSRRLIYVGGGTTLESIDGVEQTDTGRKTPKPQAE